MSLRALQGPTGGGTPVGGTGTTNTIPRWTGASTLGDSGLIDDSTSIYTSTRRVGVDTSTTLTNIKLQVGTAASLANYQGAPLGVVLPAGSGSWLELAENSASGTSFRISKDSSTGVVLNTNGKTIGFTAAGYTTAISSSQVVLTTTGNVGIGTASPGAQLQVERAGGLSNAEYLRLRNTTSGSGSAVAQDYYVHANTVATGRIQHTWNGTTYDTTLSVWNNSLSSVQEAMRIQGGGNVGIGTASPGTRLDVADTGTPSGTVGIRSLYTGTITANAGGVLALGGYFTGTSPTTFAYIVGGKDNATAGDFGGHIQFITRPNGGVYTERARIDSSGNFILNTATTGATIQAAGSQQGLKLPATPGNADTQTLDAYQEIGTGTPAEIALTLTCGTSGTITVNAASSKARVTRVGNKVIGHGRIVVSSVSAPLGRLSCVLTGCPQPFTNFLVETQTDNTTGLASGNRIVGTSDTAATPTIYFDRYSPNTSSADAAANIQAGTIIVFNICYSV